MMNTPSRSTGRGAVAVSSILFGLAWVVAAGCGGDAHPAKTDGGGDAGTDAGGAPPTPVVISTATRTPRTTTWSVNYWQWMPTYGDGITGTDALVAALKPAVMRVGGYNNDANTPDPFDDAQFDKAVAYARAIGAEPLIQVPRLADNNGQPPTPATAAAMVTYANVTRGYGIKYFSIGNEPDLYPDQGSLSDSTMPAIPGFTPADYCTAATAYVAAMKAVDPAIKIVGPELAYKYEAGNGTDDWLTPILTGCGDLFDIISIHRYPFEAKLATLTMAAEDQASFLRTIASVRGILQDTGYADKPLALTEMNVVYDATACVLDASPGTVGSALWLTDAVGAAIELGLWTSTVWDLSDTEDWSLGLIGIPPAHTPRPEYYAYQLYADHFGSTLLTAPSAPAGVSLYPSRNLADDTTQIIAVNWNPTAAPLAFQVTGLAKTPGAATFSLPPVSIVAVEIPDTGAAKAWTYGDAQRLVGSGLQPLVAGTGTASAGPDGGAGADAGPAGKTPGAGCAPVDGGLICPGIVASSPTVTTMGAVDSTGLTFGSGVDSWGSFTYTTAGPTAPTAALTSDGDGMQITGGSLSTNDYEGVGLYYNSSSCLNVAAYTGLKFDFAGTLGGCLLKVGFSASNDVPPRDDAIRGACTGDPLTCYGPVANVTAAAMAATSAAPTIQVPFASIIGGSPDATVDATKVISMQWQLIVAAGTDAGACSASFSVKNVSFY
jgi:hypothetical protein